MNVALVTKRDEVTETDVVSERPVQNGCKHSTRLWKESDRALIGLAGGECTVERRSAHTEHVRTNDTHVVLFANGNKFLLKLNTFTTNFLETSSNNNATFYTLLAAFLRGLDAELRWDNENCKFRRLRALGDSLVCLEALYGTATRVNRIDLSRISGLDDVVNHSVADFTCLSRRTNNSNGLRVSKIAQFAHSFCFAVVDLIIGTIRYCLR